MSISGLLILTSPVRSLTSHLKLLLSSAAEHVNKTLYIQLHHDKPLSSHLTFDNNSSTLTHSKVINMIYSNANAACNSLDVRILLDSLKQCPPSQSRKVKYNIDVVLTDYGVQNKELKQYLKNRFLQNLEDINVIHLLPEMQRQCTEKSTEAMVNGHCSSPAPRVYDNIVLGGTFDRLHAGHKILLSEAVVACLKQLTVGVTDESMLSYKVLPELIELTSIRIKAVKDFLVDVDPTLVYKIVPISDPFGPSTEDPDIECIIVSEETVKGGKKVNEEREKKGMKPLEISIIKLAEDDIRTKEEEQKISSSSGRMRLLGKRLRPPQAKNLPQKPYLIGLTGGIASGKTSVTKHLQRLGVAVIHSDELAHSTYSKGTEAYKRIISEFGEHVLTPNGEINRKTLGTVVFANPEKRQILNSIVWPEVGNQIKIKVNELYKRGESVIVLEIPLLIESGMDKIVHEVWVALIPKAEAIKRVKDRDKLSEKQAEQRVNAQLSNEERVIHADIVFCTLWEPEYTRKQVDKAWSEVQQLLQSTSN